MAPIEEDGSIIPGYGCQPHTFDGEVSVSPSRQITFSGPGIWSDARESFTNLFSGLTLDKRHKEPYTARARFTVPSTLVRNFHIISRGRHSRGNVLYKEGDVDSVTIDIVITYFDHAAKKTANLCLLEKNGTHQGFGIFVRHPFHDRCTFS